MFMTPTLKQLSGIFMKEIRLATKILRTLVKDRIQYPDRLVVDTLGVIGRCGILLVLYWYVFKLNNGLINGTTFIFAAWSILFYFTSSVLRLRDISREIMRDIQTGNIEVLFSKPISYLSYRIWWQVGSGLYPFLVATILGTLALVLIVGLPKTMMIGIFLPSVFLVLIGAAILSLALYSIVGFLAFWLEGINPIFWIVDTTVMILGGSYLPVALFPRFMYKLALYSPFGASQFITHTAYESWQLNWYLLIGIQIFWIITFGSIVYVLFAKAREKVSVNGG